MDLKKITEKLNSIKEKSLSGFKTAKEKVLNGVNDAKKSYKDNVDVGDIKGKLKESGDGLFKDFSEFIKSTDGLGFIIFTLSLLAIILVLVMTFKIHLLLGMFVTSVLTGLGYLRFK